MLLLIFSGIGCALAVSASLADDTRAVWQYSGGYGPSWFVQEGKTKWIIYRGDGQTFLYLEEQRTPAYIELRGPQTKLLIRLSDDEFQTRASADQPWRSSAAGSWVTREDLPRHIQRAPQGYQVRVVYFVPTDREPAADYQAKIRLILTMVAELLHDDLRSKGFRPKPLEFESRDGEMLVHLVRAREPAAFYTKDAWPNMSVQARRIHAELLPTFGDPSRHLTIVFAETYGEEPAAEAWSGHIAIGNAQPPDGGFAVYSSWVLQDAFTATTRDQQVQWFFDPTPVPGRKAFGSRLADSPRFEFIEDAFGAAIHELGHSLGCPHDYRDSRDIMGSGFRQLRLNLDPRVPPTGRVGFSQDNARLLMCSRYLATDLSWSDYDPPEVQFELRPGGQVVTAEIRAEDNTGLRALLLRTLDGRRSSVVAGKALRGKKQHVSLRLAPAELTNQAELRMEAMVADDGGNVTRVQATWKKPKSL